MRLGLALRAINAANPARSAYIELAQAAERLGYDAAWVPEIRSMERFTLLAWIGAHTESIGLGCAVAEITARTAIATAAGAVTLDGLCTGCFRLGLGVSSPLIVEGWHGWPYERPLSYMRDYLAVVLMALNDEPIRHAGREITLPLPRGADGVAPLPFPTPSSRLPVYLAGLGRRAVTLAGELADGWIAIHCPPEYMAAARPWLEDGAARTGRSLDGFITSVIVICSVDDDEELARDLARPTLAGYLGGMGSRTANFYSRLAARLGFAESAAAVQKAYLAGDTGTAIAAVDDALVDAMAVCGPKDRVRRKLADYQEAGVDTVMVGPTAPSKQDQIDQLELISSLAVSLG